MQREKQCTKCGETKPLDEYHRHKGKKDGRVSHCRKCQQGRARRWREENRDELRERKRRYREENREKELERKRRWREENREKVREIDRCYREGNRNKVRESNRRYREENRDILNQELRSRHAQYRRTSSLLASKKGVPYSPEEDAFLMADNGMSLYQKAVELGRTYASCSSRRELLCSREAVDV